MEYIEDEFTDALIDHLEKISKTRRTRVIIRKFMPFLRAHKEEWFKRNFCRKLLYKLRFES